MKPIFRLFAVALLLAIPRVANALPFSADSLSKKYSTFTSWCSPEKLFVHIDRTYFAADETIWFKGYLSNASRYNKFRPGNFIYAELLDSKGMSVVRVKVKRDGDGFPGYMYLPESLKTGEYTFRAYTLWQMNGSPEYMFNQRVRILGSEPAKHQESPAVVSIDLSFYPEGGRYFAGQASVIGVKAMDSNGRSVKSTYQLFGDSEDPIAVVSTTHDGMGRLSFLPVSGIKYYLKAEDGKRYELPEPSTDGASIGLHQSIDKISVSISGVAKGSFVLLARTLDDFVPLAQLVLDGRPKRLQLNSKMFPSGINQLVLVDGDARIVSERKFFILDTATPVCSLRSNIKTPKPHGLIKTELSLTDRNGNPLDGNCSVSIVRGSFKHHQQDDGLLSYYRLSSELKGHINNPQYYFDTNINERERQFNMDLLMMIQGWSYYDIAELVSPNTSHYKLNYLKEYAQSVKGTISRTPSSKIPTNFIFSLMIPRYKFTKFLDVAQANAFYLDSLDFEEKTHFLISLSRPGIRRDFAPKWSGDQFAPAFAYYPAPGISGATVETEKVPLVSEVVSVDTLSAAVLTASRSDAFDEFTSGRGVSASDFEVYKDYTLIEYLSIRTPAFEFDGENMYNKYMRRNGSSNDGDSEDAPVMTTDSEVPDGVVKLLIDETEQVWWTYEFVKMEDIAAISISTMAEAAYGAPYGMVTLKLKEGASLGSAQKRESYIYFVPLGYQKAKAFYSPRYDKGDVREAFDHRNTIYWSANTKVTGGKAEIDFCNTDQMDYPYIVHIEGISADGEIFSGRSVLDFQEQSY